jgi:hypothetical protein
LDSLIRITSALTARYHAAVIELGDIHGVSTLTNSNAAAGEDMKIYLLMLIIGTLLTAIHFTSMPQKPSEPAPR